MKKVIVRALALMMILVLLALPGAALAQEQTRPEAFMLTVEDFSLTVPGAEPMDIELALTVAGGLNQTGDRGLWVLDLTSAKAQAFNLTAALEGGKVKAYLQNALGGLPYLLQVPVEELAGMAQQLPQAAGGVQAEGMEQVSALLESCEDFAESMKDPAHKAEFGAKLRAALETAFHLAPAGEETIELFGASRTAKKLTGETDFAGFWAALPEICGTDPALKACFDEFARVLEESGALGEGVAFADLPRLLKEGKNGDFKVDVTEYMAGEEKLRLDLNLNAVQDGKPIGALLITIDSDTTPERPALSLTFKTDFTDAYNMQAKLESASVLAPGSEETTLSLGFESLGLNTTAFTLKAGTYMTDATAQSRAAYNISVSAEYQAPRQEDSFAASIGYNSESYEADGFPTSEGSISVEFAQGGTDPMLLSFNTLLKQMPLAEGELLTAGGLAVLDITSMTGEQSTELTEAFNTLLNNSMGLLFQDPGLAALLGGAMQ